MRKLDKEKIGGYLFWIFLVAKLIVLLSFPAIKEFKNLFIPFVEYANMNGLTKAYTHFFNSSEINIFPYSRGMYIGISLYSFLFANFFGNGFEIILIRLALLTYDVMLFKILVNLVKNKRKVILYYWCSPILLYINYIYTQLDVVPVTFLFLSILLLMKNKIKSSYLVLGLSVAAKVNGLVVLPFYLFYLYRKNIKIKDLMLYSILPFIAYIILNIDLVQNSEFIKMVLLNSQQASVFSMKIGFNNNSFYIVPIIYITLLLVAVKFKFYTQDLFMIFLCFSFLVLTSLGINNAGWYYWVIPFLAYFYAKSKNFSKEIYLSFNIFYFLFFLSRNIEATIVENLFFTFFQFTLYANAYIIYIYVVKNIIKCKLKYIPFLIGVGGDSGVGKTTFTQLLEELFSKDDVLTIKGDDMHRWERGDKNWEKLTHLSPKANMLYQNYKHLEELKMQKSIERQHYDHSTGKFTDKILMKSKRIVIFEGLHPFYIKKNRQLYDLKIYVKPEEKLRLHWKITRDMEKRGYTKEKVLQQLEQREEDSKKYIASQEKYSDLTISYYNVNDFQEIGNNKENIKLGLAIKLDNTLDLDFIIDELLEKTEIKIEHFYDEDFQVLKFEGEVEKHILKNIFSNNYSEIEEVFSNHLDIKNGYEGILQLIIVNFIFEFNLKGDN